MPSDALSLRDKEGAAMKNIITYTRCERTGLKSILLTICLAMSMLACEKAPERPMPPQAPPTPKAVNKGANAGNPHPGLYDASNVSGAVFKYKASSKLEYQNAQGKKIKRRVIRT
ncbi:MAG: hypothetical protein ACO1NO_01720 [Burkholderiaceae bacterium]